MEAVLSIAKRGSFRAAALDLGLSTTGLSHRIARLEATIGLRLFNRTTRSVALTDAGRAFALRLGPALSDIRAALDSAKAQAETPSGLLRINAAPQAAEALAPLVLSYLRHHPQMQVDLVSEARLVDIVAEGFDLGIRQADLVPRDMIALPLGSSLRHAVVAAPAWLARHPRPLSPADIDPAQCLRLRLPTGAPLRWPLEKDGVQLPVEAAGRLSVDTAALARAAVLDGFGIGYLFEQDVADDIAAGRMIRLLEDWTPPRPGFSLYYPGRRNPSAGFTALLTMLRNASPAAPMVGPPR